MIMFGSRVDVFLPPGVQPVVKKGERVRAGLSALGRVQEPA
jgi:phosphatidylserine decarboxylase